MLFNAIFYRLIPTSKNIRLNGEQFDIDTGIDISQDQYRYGYRYWSGLINLKPRLRGVQ